jgi:hypothetical protein
MRCRIVVHVVFAWATYDALVTAAVVVGAFDFDDPLLHAPATRTAKLTAPNLQSLMRPAPGEGFEEGTEG